MHNPAISVIIVSYNVRYFLDQCLHSLSKSLEGISSEIFVVDNHSSDSSVELVQTKYPLVKLIANLENVGFARANNQALALAKGGHILLLNPDTLVREDTLRLSLDFFNTHSDAGALGVKLIDGTGQYLPESKRGLPTPWVAFCRLSGLGRLFPHSPLFNSYYLGHLSADTDQRVDILCGAFMMISAQVLAKVGPLDDSFFMYGEDVDWSYRIQQAGYTNYYFAGTSIIHYKGESSHRDSWPYLKHFYQAMSIFAAKHFTGQKFWYRVLLRMAIGFKGLVSLLSSLLHRTGSFLLDVIILAIGYYALKEAWERFYHHDNYFYPPFYDYVLIPGLAVFFAFAFSSGGLLSPAPEPSRLLKRWFGLSIAVLITYALLPLQARPSRALLLLSLVFTFFYLIIHLAIKKQVVKKSYAAKLVIVGSEEEYLRVRDFLDSLRITYRWLGHLDTVPPFSAQLLADYCTAYHVDELIFCSRSMSFSQITEAMSVLGKPYRYRIASVESDHIISSSSSRKPGELYTYAIRFPLQDVTQRLNKRIFDVVIALALAAASPVLVWIYACKKQYIRNLWLILSAKKTWVGYNLADRNLASLPVIRPGVLECSLKYSFYDLQAELLHKLNVIYAREYDVWVDLDILIKGFFQLDQKL